jgi:hypothetical protein
MGRFKYTDNENLPRGNTLDPIIHSALIIVQSACMTSNEVEYTCVLTDVNLPEPVRFLFTVDSQQWRVTGLKRLETILQTTDDALEQAKAVVWMVLGDDFDNLCYGIQVRDIPQRLGRPIKYDLHIDSTGRLDFTHFGYDLPPEEDTED